MADFSRDEYEQKIADLKMQLDEAVAARVSSELEAKRVYGLLKVELNNNAQSKRAYERKDAELRERERLLRERIADPESAWRDERDGYMRKIDRLSHENSELKAKISHAKEVLR